MTVYPDLLIQYLKPELVLCLVPVFSFTNLLFWMCLENRTSQKAGFAWHLFCKSLALGTVNSH